MLFDRLLSQIAPHECLSCFAEGALLCQDCVRYLIPAPSACYHCHKPTKAARTCAACLPFSNLSAVRAATMYKAITKDLVWHLKFHGTQAAASEIAEQLVSLYPNSPDLSSSRFDGNVTRPPARL